ncbi:MAG: VOC family protein [Pseudomonadota bacterium]
MIASLDHLVLTVRDIEATVSFYRRVLGMHGEQRTALHFGRQKINLHPAGAPFLPHALAPTPGSADLCFLTDRSLAQVMEHLQTEGVTIEQGPVRRTGAVGPLLSVYLRDPDGNLIEIAELLAD